MVTKKSSSKAAVDTPPAKRNPDAHEVAASKDTTSQKMAKLVTMSAGSAVTLQSYSGGGDALEPRDLTHLIGRPARVLVGAHDAPLKPGEAQSVVDDESRARLLAQPDVWLTTVNSAGHVLPGRAAALILRILREMVIDAARAAKDIALRGDAPRESSD